MPAKAKIKAASLLSCSCESWCEGRVVFPWLSPIRWWPRSEIMAKSKVHLALPSFYGQVCAKTVFSLQEGPCIITWRSQGSLTWGHRLKDIYKESRDVLCQIFWIVLFSSRVWTKYIAVLAFPIPSINFYFDFLSRWITKPAMPGPSLLNTACDGKK